MEQLQSILTDLDNKAITKHQAYDLILVLFDVSRRSEQLIDFAIKNGYIEDMPKGNKIGLIDRFEKSINCY